MISILGFVNFAAGLGTIYATLTPAFVGGPIDPVYASAILLLSIIGLLIYPLAYLYNRSKGIDLLLLFREVPPL